MLLNATNFDVRIAYHANPHLYSEIGLEYDDSSFEIDSLDADERDEFLTLCNDNNAILPICKASVQSYNERIIRTDLIVLFNPPRQKSVIMMMKKLDSSFFMRTEHIMLQIPCGINQSISSMMLTDRFDLYFPIHQSEKLIETIREYSLVYRL